MTSLYVTLSRFSDLTKIYKITSSACEPALIVVMLSAVAKKPDVALRNIVFKINHTQIRYDDETNLPLCLHNEPM